MLLLLTLIVGLASRDAVATQVEPVIFSSSITETARSAISPRRERILGFSRAG
jgi:hypothetical protein